MELKEFVTAILELYKIEDVSMLNHCLLNTALNHEASIYDAYLELVSGDLKKDYLRNIFQYYQADRIEKMQDYTPDCLAVFMGKFIPKDKEVIIDLCAGSGTLAINAHNHGAKGVFELYEIDDNVIGYLLFNLAVRNMNGTAYLSDVLKRKIYKKYTIQEDEKYSKVCEEVMYEYLFN